MSGFKSFIPRSQRSDNLAKMFSLGTSGQKQDIDDDKACCRDNVSLDQLSRLHSRGNVITETQTGESNIAAQTPIPETGSQDDLYHVAASDRVADSDGDYADVSDDDYDNDCVDGDAHYDSLHKRSPALMNPSYFDAVRSSPCQGFGLSSSRYLESSHSNHNLSMDDFDFEGDTLADSPRQAGGFGLSGFERSPGRAVEGLSFGGRHYDRNDPHVQILDIPMPDPDVLEELANAPPREGKDSPFRSYHGYEPDLTDIEEETEPESDSGPVVIPSPLKNRHENRSRSHSVTKLQSSPFAHDSPGSERGFQSPRQRRKITFGSSASNDSKRSSNADIHRQNSPDAGNGDISALGFNHAAGSLAKIEEEKDEDAAATKAKAFFACMKAPAPFVANNSHISGGAAAPLPFDFSNTGRKPLSITQEERTRLFNEPCFIKEGVIPKEYIRFEEPQQENSQLEHSQPADPEPEKPTFPVRGSSLNATPRKNATSLIVIKSPMVLKGEMIALCRKIAEDFCGTDIGNIAEASALYGIDYTVDNHTAHILNELGNNEMPFAEFMVAAGVSAKVIHGIMKKAVRSTKTTIEIYAEIGGSDYVKEAMSLATASITKKLHQKADGTGTVKSAGVDAECINKRGVSSYDALETSVTGMSAHDAVEKSVLDPFSNEPNTTFYRPVAERAAKGTGGTTADWANGIMANIDDIAAISIASPVSGAVEGLRFPTLRGGITGTNVGSVARGTAAGTASRFPHSFMCKPLDDNFRSIDEVLGHEFPVGNSAGSAGIRGFGNIDDIIGGPVGNSASSADTQENLGSIDDVIGRETPVGKSAGSAGSPTPKPKTKPQYGLFPQVAASPRSQSEAVAADCKLSLDKLLPAGVTSSGSSSKDDAYHSFLALNKPLPVISPSGDSPAVSLNFPGLPDLQRTPSEKKELAAVKRFGSGVKKQLKKFWSKSDEDLGVKQATERDNRADSANRLKALAQDTDANQVVQTPKKKYRTGRFPHPVVAAADIGENHAIQTPTPKKRGVSMNAIAAAMGLGGLRKSIGENTRVNGA